MDVTKTQEVTTPQQVAPQQVVTTTTSTPQPAGIPEHPQQVFQKKKAIFRTHQIIWYILAVVEILLGFRMSLKALGANPSSGFTSTIYAISDLFALPFRGILPVSISNNSVIEWSTLVAAIVYFVIAYGIIHLIHMLKPVTPQEVSQTVDNV